MNAPSPYLQTLNLLRSALQVLPVGQRDQADASLRHWLETTGFPDSAETLDALAFGLHLGLGVDAQTRPAMTALSNLAVLRAGEHRRIGAEP